MKFKDLIKTNSWLSIKLTLLNLYPDQVEIIDEYEKIFQNLKIMPATESNIQIVLEEYCDEESCYVDVSGLEEENPEIGMAIEFVPWTKWLGMSINMKSLKDFNELEIISHCLYEMTFIGYDEDEIQAQFSRVEKTVEDYKNMTEEEKEEKQENTTSLEEMLKKNRK